MSDTPLEAARKRWNACHEAHAADPLSGSNPVGVLKHHGLIKVSFTGLNALDIGVGLGGMSKHLHACGAMVDALDIADAAVHTVAPFIRTFYTDASQLPDDEYEIAISHLVAQHMYDGQLRDQIRGVFRALRPGGVFSLHLAAYFSMNERNDLITADIPEGLDGAMGRTRPYAYRLIEEELKGGYGVTEAAHQVNFPQFGSYLYFLHIRKNDAR